MTVHTLQDYASKTARRIGLKAGAILSCLLFACTLSGMCLVATGRLDELVGGQIENFSFWVQANDFFQIGRSLRNIVDQEQISAAAILDVKSKIIDYKGPANLRSLTLDRRGWLFDGGDLYLVRSYPLEAVMGSDHVLLGQIKATLQFPLEYLYSSILVLIAITCTLVISLERIIFQVAKTFVTPVESLARAAESANSPTDLQQVEQSQFREINDLTDKMREMASRLVKQEWKLIEAEKLKSVAVVATQVAHDIRSPLSAVRMVTQTMNEVNDQHKSLLFSACQRIESIAEDLLNRYKREDRLRPFDLLTACQKIVGEKRTTAAAILMVQSNAVEKVYALGNEHDFQRLFSNVLNNAIEAVNGVASPEIVIVISEHAEIIRVKISDNGCGISDEAIEHINLNQQFTTKKHGTGIGLHNAQTLLRKWGGKLKLLKNVPSGTTVLLTLRRAPVVERKIDPFDRQPLT